MNTATSQLVTRFMSPSRLLSRAFATDAAVTAAFALAVLFAADPLASLLNLPPPLLRGCGVILIPFALFVAWLSRRTRVHRAVALAVIALNVLWALDSVLLLFTGWVEPNGLGEGFTLLQAIVVAALAQAEFMGLRRSTVVESFAPH